MNLFLATHNDDESLWGAFTLMREHPLVFIVTDSWIQFNRGENITADERWEETIKAMVIVRCPVMRLAIRDDVLDEWSIKNKLSRFSGLETVYAPAIQGGNIQHDLVGKVADELFGVKVKHYAAYTQTEPYTTGKEEIIPTEEELVLKEKMLDCYKTQLGNVNKIYFDAVKGKSEWYI